MEIANQKIIKYPIFYLSIHYSLYGYLFLLFALNAPQSFVDNFFLIIAWEFILCLFKAIYPNQIPLITG
jgi:hypothetical protein